MNTIDLSKWKLTIPIQQKGKVVRVAENIRNPELSNYRNNSRLKDYMYEDPSDSSIVLSTHSGVTTPHTSFPRTELREQKFIDSSRKSLWNLEQGGKMRAVAKIEDVSIDEDGWPNTIIVAQIHGALSLDQCERLDKGTDNHFLPNVKVGWYRGFITVETKRVNETASTEEELLDESNWTDAPKIFFPSPVGYNKFCIEIIADQNHIEVILNDDSSILLDDESVTKWKAYNYFKVGNYLQSKEPDAYSKVKLYELKVTH